MKTCKVLLLVSALVLGAFSAGNVSAQQAESVLCWKENRAVATNVSANPQRRFRAEVIGPLALLSVRVELVKPGETIGTLMTGRLYGTQKVIFEAGTLFQDPSITDTNYPDGTYTFRVGSGGAPDLYSAQISGGYPPFPTITAPSDGQTVPEGTRLVTWTIPNGAVLPTGFIFSAENLSTGTKFSEIVQDPQATSRSLPVGFLGLGHTASVTVTSYKKQPAAGISWGEKRTSNYVRFSIVGPTPSPSPTLTPSITPTETATNTQTQTPTITQTPTVTATQTVTPTNSTPIPTSTPTMTPVYLRSDADANGVVDENDLLILLNEWRKTGIPAPR